MDRKPKQADRNQSFPGLRERQEVWHLSDEDKAFLRSCNIFPDSLNEDRGKDLEKPHSGWND